VQQTVTIPTGSIATLSYFLKIGNVTTPSNSVLTVSIDGALVQTVSEPETSIPNYAMQVVDLSAFADGAPRLLSFNYSRPAGTSGSDSFMIDDAALGINCGTAMASITGRVLTSSGLGLQNSVVALTDSTGMRRIAMTSSFGVFSFDSVGTGQVYTIGVSSKRYRFAPRTIVVTTNLTNLDFLGLQ